MEWLEANPLPIECQHCNEEECYNCDFAAARWRLSEVDQLKLERKRVLKSIMRLQQKLDEIDTKLAKLENNTDDPNVLMTLEQWVECIGACYENGDSDHLKKICNEYPQFIKAMHEKHKIEMADPDSNYKRWEEANWERMKKKLRNELGDEWVAEHCK